MSDLTWPQAVVLVGGCFAAATALYGVCVYLAYRNVIKDIRRGR